MRIVFIFNSRAICAAACQSRWKKSGVFNFAEQTRRGGLSRAVWLVSIFVFFLFSRPFFWLQPAEQPPVNKHVPVQETGSPMRLTLQAFSFCCCWVRFISSRLYQSHPVSSSALPGVAVSCHVAIVAVCIIPNNEQRPQNMSQTQTTRSENIALPTITPLSSSDNV